MDNEELKTPQTGEVQNQAAETIKTDEKENNALVKKMKKEKKRKRKLKRWFRFLKVVYWTVGRIILPVKRLGHTEKFNDRSYVYVGNHLHVLDVIPVALSLNKPVHYMAKKELTEKRIGRWFTKKCECIIVNRDGSDVRALMQAMKYLKDGESVCCFPEGTRNKTKEIFLPFKSGAAALAIKTRTPIVMMMQCKKIRLFRKNYFYYAEPFEFSEYYGKKMTEADIQEADEKLRQKMLETYYELDEILKNMKKKKSKDKKNKQK